MPDDQLSQLAEILNTATTPSEGLGEGERREVVVLFLDIVGFTTLTDKLKDPEKAYRVVSGTFTTFSDIIAQHQGKVDKYIGDAILAVWGTQHQTEFDAELAIGAACGIYTALARLNKLLAPNGIELQARIGINAGLAVFVPTPNSDPNSPDSWTVIGSVVNLAQRLENRAEPGTVLVSGAVRELAGEAFLYQDVGLQNYKGFDEPVQTFSVVGKGPGRKNPWERVELVRHSRIVGRDTELANLHAKLKATPELNDSGFPKPFLLGIKSEAGMGKSRLCHEFIAGVKCPVLKGQTLAYAQPPYWMWITLLRDYFVINELDSDAYEKLKAGIEKIPDATTRSRLELSLPYLALLLGISGPESERVKATDSRVQNQEIKLGLRWLLEGLASNHPLVVLLEDYHWIDTSSESVLKHILNTVEPINPILFLLPYRPERSLPKVYGEVVVADEIVLGEISDSDCLILLRSMLGSSLPEDVENFILARAEGNPFYIEEVVLSLVSRGILLKEKEHWVVTQRLTDADVPHTVHSLILSRIDGLEHEHKELLKQAAVIGRAFLLEVLNRMNLKLTVKFDTDECIKELMKVELIFESLESRERTYLFKHTITREVAYNMFLEANRKMLHRVVAEVMEEMFSDSDSYAAMIADHWEKSESNQCKVIDWGIKAVTQCRNSFQHAEGLALCEKLIGMMESANCDDGLDKRLWELLLDKQWFLEFAGRSDESLTTLRKMETLCRERDWQTELGRTLYKIGMYFYSRGDHQTLLDVFREAEPIIRQSGDNYQLSDLLSMKGFCHLLENDIDTGIACTKDALEKAEASGNWYVVYVAKLTLCKEFETDPYSKQYDALFDEYLSHCRRNNIRINETAALIDYARIQLSRHNTEKARECLEDALLLAKLTGNSIHLAHVQYTLSIVNYIEEAYEVSLHFARKALDMFTRFRNMTSIAECQCRIGMALNKLDRYEEALAAYHEGIETARQCNYFPCEINILIKTGELELDCRQVSKAHRLYNKIMEESDESQAIPFTINLIVKFRKKLIEAGIEERELPIPNEYLIEQADVYHWYY